MRYAHLFFYVYVVPLASGYSGYRSNDCLHPSQMTSCFSGVLGKLRNTRVEGGNLGLASELKTIKQMCKLIDESKPCVVFRLTKCSSWHQPTVDFYVNSLLPQGLVKLCIEPGILEAYSLQGPCLNEHQSAAYACVEKGPGPLNASTHLASPQSMSSYCKSLSEVFSCGWETLAPLCGNQTVDLFIRVVTLFMPSYVTEVCRPRAFGHDHQGVTSRGHDNIYTRLPMIILTMPVLLMIYNIIEMLDMYDI